MLYVFFLFTRLLGLLHILIGIAYLQLFIIDNFLGPKSQLNDLEQAELQVDICLLGIDFLLKFHFKGYNN